MIDLVGNLPNTWKWCPLKHATVVLRRGSTPEYTDDGPIHVVNQAVNQGHRLEWPKGKFHAFFGDPCKLKGHLKESDLLINSTGTGTLGRVGFFSGSPDDRPAIADSHITIARMKNDLVHPRYAYYWLSSRKFHELIYSTMVVGSTNQIELNREYLSQAPIPLPPLGEQRRIVDFLDAETSKIGKVEKRASRQEELLLERRRSFIDSLISGDSLRDPDWVPLRYVINPSLTTGREKGKVLSVYRDYGIIPKDSRSDNFNKTPEDLTRYLAVNVNDVVVNKMKAWQGSLGVSPYSGIVSPDYLVARPTLPNITPKYLHYTLRSPKFVEEYRIRSRGIRPAQWRLYWEDMAEIRFPVISPGRQREISDALEAEEQRGEGLLKAIRSRRKLLAERRQALITAAVTGQIDVTTARGADVS